MSIKNLDFINVRRIAYRRFNVRFIKKGLKTQEYNVSNFRMNRFLDFINTNTESFYTYPYIDCSEIALEIGRN